jgi:hypothetical protein
MLFVLISKVTISDVLDDVRLIDNVFVVGSNEVAKSLTFDKVVIVVLGMVG